VNSSQSSSVPEVSIKIESVTKTYDRIVALDSLSLDIHTGEIIGLLGPNGAGKTSLLSILSAAIKPSDGSVHISGIDILKNPRQIKSLIGVVPQDISLYNELTSEENIFFFSRMYGVRGKSLIESAQKLLRFAGLESRKDDHIKTLSGGMKRRINFACGLVNSPKILLLDEPTVGIDPQSREHIYAMIKELKTSGVTILLATHYISEAEALCDRIAIIDKGKILMVHTINDYFEIFREKLKLTRIDMEKIFLHVTGKELRD